MVQKQAAQKTQHDIRTKQRQFTIGQAVMVNNLHPRGDQWIPGVIVRQSGTVTYHVDVGEGNVWKQDHFKFRDLPEPEADLVSPQAESDLDATIPTVIPAFLPDNGASEPSTIVTSILPSTERNSTPEQAQVVDTLLGSTINSIHINM